MSAKSTRSRWLNGLALALLLTAVAITLGAVWTWALVGLDEHVGQALGVTAVIAAGLAFLCGLGAIE